MSEELRFAFVPSAGFGGQMEWSPHECDISWRESGTLAGGPSLGAELGLRISGEAALPWALGWSL